MEQFQSQRILQYLAGTEVARSRELTQQGFHRVILSRLAKQGAISRLARGLYTLSTQDSSEWIQLAEIAKTSPRAVIGLLSALAFHEIGTQAPHQTWIVLPEGAWIPTGPCPIQAMRCKEPFYSAGIQVHRIESVDVRIYCAAKTVADCFRMRNRIGYDVAVEALKEGWRARKFSADELVYYAKINRVDKIMRPYMESIIE